MKRKRSNSTVDKYYKILAEKSEKGVIYKLFEFELPCVSGQKRRRILEAVMERTGAYALIEWWTRGSILYKPKYHFHAILLFKRRRKR
ncbi:MAG: hypothetical protein QW385_04200 [Thermoproteota archaeon]